METTAAPEQITIPEAPEMVAVLHKRPRFAVRDALMALLIWLAMLLRIELGNVAVRPTGGFLFAVGLIGLSLLYMRLDKIRLTLRAGLAAGLSLLFAGILLLGGQPLLLHLCFTASFVCRIYFLLTAYGASGETRLGRLIGFDALKAFLVLPFSSLGALFPALFRRKREKGGSKAVLWVFLGLFLAIIPVIITLAVFAMDDVMFRDFLGKIQWPRFPDIMRHIGNSILALPLALWVFGLFTSLREKKCERALSAGGHEKFRKALRICPSALLLGFIAPLLLVYAVYIGFTMPNIFAAFSGNLPAAYTASAFAREGFFSLCFIGAVNTGYAYLLSVLHKQPTRTSEKLGNWAVGLLSALNLLLSAQAAARLWLYISRFGLSLLRVYAGWFILLLSICFIWIFIRQLHVKFPVARCIVFTGTAMLLLLAILSPARLVARYNVARIEAETWYVDVDSHKVFMDEGRLLPEAVPELARLPKDTVLGYPRTYYTYESTKDVRVGDLLAKEREFDAREKQLSPWERLLRFSFTSLWRDRAMGRQ
ncbi:MAG: DUF4173 domain-containing protein [Clostridiales bacterium]|nr:DUF4173 domain-containing protein [Clostridiales bacterium]